MSKLGDMASMFQKAQQMQTEMKKVQEELEKKTVEATAGGGMVKVVANGKQQIVSLTLDDEVMTLGDRDMLQDLILSGVNEAIKSSQEMMQSEMRNRMAANLGPMGSLMNMFS